MPQTIVFLHPHFTIPGGAGKFVLETGKRLAQSGYRVVVISIRSADSITGEYKKFIRFVDIGGPLSSSPLFWFLFLFSYVKISRILSQYNNFILFPQIFPANWWGFIYKKFHPGINSVWMCQEPSAFIHSQDWIGAIHNPAMRTAAKILNPVLKIIDISLAKNVDIVLANSQFSRRNILKTYRYEENTVITNYLGIDADTFKPDLKIKKKLQFIAVGRLSKFKNFDMAIHAVAELIPDYPGLRLIIVGDGEERENLEKITGKLKMEKHIYFTGNVTNNKLCRLYQESLASLHLSFNEPFGLVPVESMACGTPVVAFASGGIRETVVDGKTGLLSANSDITPLLRKVLETGSGTYSKDCIIRASNFDWNKTAEKLDKIIRAL